MQNNIFRLLRALHYLSFDVAAGAGLNALIINKMADVEKSIQASLMLSGVVLLIYWFDHYLDFIQSNYKVTQPHHEFVFKHQSILLATSFCIAIGLLLLLIHYNFLENKLLAAACLLMILLYFLYNQLLYRIIIIPKEIVVSLIYAFGITALAFITKFQLQTIGLFVLLFLITMQNMLMVNSKEWPVDYLNQKSNLRKYLSERRLKQISFLLFVIQILLSIAMFIILDDSMLHSYLLFLITNGLVQQILTYSNTKHYRIYGEAAYLLPVIVLIIV